MCVVRVYQQHLKLLAAAGAAAGAARERDRNGSNLHYTSTPNIAIYLSILTLTAIA